ncbi:MULTISPECIES: potassium-transporting ATPase subunit KdpC [unclassified Devosia]|uniref:potassium-transporting ATPase subunit KdpC n=1 Tax=unclassified Devosia TaxID=196773 RepID=UPI0025FC6F63|nr:potassium-transporting ATPase subunit KdpC [Devosia sp.]MCR6634130.1 potassium-transporting ATPase subunit KdpC [Devosia sp.]
MLNQARPAIVSMLLFSAILGGAYPAVVTAAGGALFPAQAEGSLVRNAEGVVVGSKLIGQVTTSPGYLWPRPSAAGDGYNAAGSSGSNLGPLNPVLIERVAADAAAVRAYAPEGAIPPDAVTTSGSGLDPEISPEFAALQVDRIAEARGIEPSEVVAVVAANTEAPLLGFIGQARVNVLMTNLALDSAYPLQPAAE